LDGFEARARARGFRTVAGVDEAGRGPLAGPVVAAAVVLPTGFPQAEIRDSKALSPKAREKAFLLITSHALAFAVAHSSPEEIDRINILRASLLAMRRAVEKLKPVPDFLFVARGERSARSRSFPGTPVAPRSWPPPSSRRSPVTG
jgi:ribonuclease HII